MLLATGMDYRYPDLPGVAERWGRSVFHCPFCHGWEVRGRPLGVLDRDAATGVHRAMLLRAWTDDVTLLTDGPSALDADGGRRLRAAGVTIDERRVERLRGPGDDLDAVVFADGTERSLGGLLVAVTLHQRSDLAAQLGAVAVPPGPIAADAIDVDAMLGHVGRRGVGRGRPQRHDALGGERHRRRVDGRGRRRRQPHDLTAPRRVTTSRTGTMPAPS